MLKWPLILLVVVFTDLALFRLALPLFEPAASGVLGLDMPSWFVWGQRLSVFFFYFSTFLCGVCLWNIQTQILSGLAQEMKTLARLGFLLVLVLLAGSFAFLFFRLNTVFAIGMEGATLLLCVAAWLQAIRREGVFSRTSIAGFFLLLPYVFHFVGFLFFSLFENETGLWNGTVEWIQMWTQVSIGLSLIVATICFLERPVLSHVTRVLPFVAAMVVSLVARIFIANGYTYFSEVFERGFGVVLSTSPGWVLQLVYTVLVTLFAWTASMLFTSNKESQMQLGIGLSLLVFAGFSFSWPMQYLSCSAGFWVMLSKKSDVSWMTALDKEMSV